MYPLRLVGVVFLLLVGVLAAADPDIPVRDEAKLEANDLSLVIGYGTQGHR